MGTKAGRGWGGGVTISEAGEEASHMDEFVDVNDEKKHVEGPPRAGVLAETLAERKVFLALPRPRSLE
eukprot:CAMPEP_0113692296 /NCGR_PEP_ID=MMETSP0038_2-20120614/18999_1 /TAXON_ID=2898 /ORGANISM="Cryptomonas paramecium" /LENGTH=67 /DNA_ID=CAMNT_0000614179 /DNA_START=96 /DNA_END=299 /DNA_ORIENTATION=+ /assembly_acc=CAM_ASM_000170